ncbi:hypothetical protein NMY22_g18022 [Coprinellus aureogranulatus]|nr:hypothetical protein NMY22_g18022 [Coprinellus aureogranulatus]
MAATETPGFTGLFVQPPEKAGSYGISANAMSHRHHVWKYSLSIPFLFSIVSALILVLHVAITRRTVIKLLHRLERRKNEDINETLATAPPSYESTFPEEIKERAEKHGGAWLFSLKFMRLLGCIVFLFLTTYTAVLNEESCHTGTCKNNIKGKKKSRLIVSERELQDLGMCLTSLYAAFLSLVTVGNKRRWSRIATHHLNLVLLVCLAVYAYRDVLPLATFTLSPSDRKEGWVLWAKVDPPLSPLPSYTPCALPRKYHSQSTQRDAKSGTDSDGFSPSTTFAFLDRPCADLETRLASRPPPVLPAPSNTNNVPERYLLRARGWQIVGACQGYEALQVPQLNQWISDNSISKEGKPKWLKPDLVDLIMGSGRIPNDDDVKNLAAYRRPSSKKK